MRWVLVSNPKAILQEFHLMDKNGCKIVLKFNPIHHSARIYCDGQYRLFFIEHTHSLNNRTVFRNEYGMEIGSLSFDKWQRHEGTIIMDTEKYSCKFHHHPENEIIIYKNDPNLPLISCTLSNNQERFSTNEPGIDNSYFLLGLCWFLELPVYKVKGSVYAA